MMLISDIRAETVGLDPTCRFTRPFLSGEVLLPVQPCLHSAVRGTRTPSPQDGSPVFKTGPLPIVASQRSTQGGSRTRKLEEHKCLRLERLPVSPPGHKVQEEGIEPSKLCV